MIKVRVKASQKKIRKEQEKGNMPSFILSLFLSSFCRKFKEGIKGIHYPYFIMNRKNK